MKQKRRIFQVMEALDYGDAVSSITISVKELLGKSGYTSQVLTKFCNDKVQKYAVPYESVKINSDDIVIFHYWNYNTLGSWINKIKCKKVFWYHNITPECFYEPGSQGVVNYRKAQKQIQEILPSFNLLIGDSEYNVSELRDITGLDTTGFAIPPALDIDELKEKKYDEKLLKELKKDSVVNIIFVGRFAPNKAHNDIINIFRYYNKFINRKSKLHLIGNNVDFPDYVSMLGNMIEEMELVDSAFIHGKVSYEEMYSYYHGADLFLSMSDHEGFCCPLIEAMVFEIPVVAYEAAAVPETMGGAGTLVNTKDPYLVGELINIILSQPGLKEQITEKQKRICNKYTLDNVMSKLLEIDKIFTNC